MTKAGTSIRFVFLNNFKLEIRSLILRGFENNVPKVFICDTNVRKWSMHIHITRFTDCDKKDPTTRLMVMLEIRTIKYRKRDCTRPA